MPSGSYTDGQTKTSAAERISRICSVGSISCTQNTPSRGSASSATASAISAAISGVSGAPAHSTSWMSGIEVAVPRRARCRTPFCRVIRPTNAAIGRSGSTPSSASTDPRPSAPVAGMPRLGVDAVAHHVDRVGSRRGIGVAARRCRIPRSPRSPRRRTRRRCVRPSERPGSRRRAARPSTAGAAPANARSGHAACRTAAPARCPASPVYQVCECTTSASCGRVGHPQLGREHLQRGVGAGEFRVGRVDDVRPSRGGAHAVHVDVAQVAQVSDEFGDVYTGAAVDLGRILPGHHRHAHDSKR